MSLLQVSPEEQAIKHSWHWGRLAILVCLLLLSLLLYILLGTFAQPNDAYVPPFLGVWFLSFVPYLGACIFVFKTHPLPGRQQIVELGLIFLAALVFRALLLPQSPWLSRDSWRYLWDARVILHGYSPYVYPPDSPVLAPLRDSLVYANSGYLDVPTIYPPAAQAIYIISYLLAPSNLFFFKGILIGFEMLSCFVLALLLRRKELDPRRVILYAWCPLPIVEFAIEGHIDATTVTFMLLAIFFAADTRLRGRILTGLFIALATLTKIYPLILLLVVMRRRDWALLVTCLTTIALGYIPFIILGHGQILGFFLTYASEQRQNAGPIPLLIHSITYGWLHQKDRVTNIVQFSIDAVLMGSAVAGVVLIRLRKRVFHSDAATLFLICMVYLVSSHIFPWYNTALLPWIALLIGPLWTREGLSGKGVAMVTLWYFTIAALTGYVYRNAPMNGWGGYYMLAYIVPLIGFAMATSLMYLQTKTAHAAPRA